MTNFSYAIHEYLQKKADGRLLLRRQGWAVWGIPIYIHFDQQLLGMNSSDKLRAVHSVYWTVFSKTLACEQFRNRLRSKVVHLRPVYEHMSSLLLC